MSSLRSAPWFDAKKPGSTAWLRICRKSPFSKSVLLLQPPTPAPVFPEFPVRAAILGKMFSGKSTLISRLTRHHRIVRLAIDLLISNAVEAYQHGELAVPSRDSELG